MRAGFWEILLIVILVLILFGHSKIPDLMKNLANGINIFKKELKTDNKKADTKSTDVRAEPAKQPVKKAAATKKPAVKKVAKKPATTKKTVAKKK
ncbi:twin-arginine translocase TatA/TatE family subunit [Lachnospiraceae bacterium OttesenSCG-928-E19]|nr:twin-arginine translocase TatA/TatE family subunit [Lachnospiraceae bacterium OttesenSCG-928-E19]